MHAEQRFPQTDEKSIYFFFINQNKILLYDYKKGTEVSSNRADSDFFHFGHLSVFFQWS